MPDEKKEQAPVEESADEKQTDERKPAAATDTATREKPKQSPPSTLPPWNVILHNDDVNDMEFVVETVAMVTTLNMQDSTLRTIEAHEEGQAVLLSTHKERAELYQQQFASRNLTVTIEPAE